jgi:6-phosphogluconolactonase
MEKKIVADVAELGKIGAERFAQMAKEAIAARGTFTCALTGGSSAKATYPLLATAAVDWSKVHLYWGDERAVPPYHADSNYKLALDALLDKIKIPAGNVHRMKADEPTGAEDYERDLPATFDLVHLGMGPDGHVCSLFPGHAALGESAKRVVWINDSPKPPPKRLTVTMPVLHAARAIDVLVAGAEKADAVKAAIEDPASRLPVALAGRGAAKVTWIVDRAASAKLVDGGAR